METLRTICNISASVFCGFAFIITLATFCTSVVACFSKKMQGKLWAKVLVAIVFGCVCPWILWLTLFFIGRIM